MALTPQHGAVLPMGDLHQVEDNILTVVGEQHLPISDMQRRMTVVRLADSRLVVYSPMTLSPQAMQRVEAFGRPGFLVVTTEAHRLDALAWKQRFPSIRVVAPSGVAERIAHTLRVDAVHVEFGDSNVRYITVPGTRGQEAALLVRSRAGMTLVLNDLVSNIRHTSGFGGFLLRMMRFAGERPHIPMPVRLALVADRPALRRQLLVWAREHSLRRILVAHGDPIEGRPGETLRELAATL